MTIINKDNPAHFDHSLPMQKEIREKEIYSIIENLDHFSINKVATFMAFRALDNVRYSDPIAKSEAFLFISKIINNFERALRHSIQLSKDFYKKGLSITLTDEKPTGFLAMILEEINIKLNFPSHLKFSLGFDHESCLEGKELYFIFQELRDDKIIYKKKFAIKELGEPFNVKANL